MLCDDEESFSLNKLWVVQGRLRTDGHDPSAWMDRKANLTGRLSDDLDADRGGMGGSLPGIAAVGKHFDDERERALRQAQDDWRTIAALHVSRLGFRIRPHPSMSTIT
jgi:hypothetical protein